MPVVRGRPSAGRRRARAEGGLKIVSLWIDAGLWQKVKVAAVSRQTTIADLVADAIAKHLEPQTRRPAS